MADEAIRVVIADDHEVVRRGLRLFLDLQPDLAVVGEAADGLEAVERTADLDADVVLMDVVMPRMDGLAATEALRERAPRARVLVLSSFGDDDRVVPALRAGAAGYLLKDARPEELAAGIRAVHAGEPVLCTEAVRRLIAELTGVRRRPEGTVTVLFTDIEGSTRLLETLGEREARGRFQAHDAIVREVAGKHGGVEVEHEGDAFMFAFSSARRAVASAGALQRALAARGPDGVRVRAGLNTGEVVADGDRYFGRAVFVASRVTGEAKGGEVLVSDLTRAVAGDEGFRYRDRGAHTLRGLKGEHRLHELDWAEP